MKDIKTVTNILSTKANTLSALSKVVKKSTIEKIKIITVSEFVNNKLNVCKEIKNAFGGAKIVVRSSSSNEDSYAASNAGHYDSVLNVDSADEESIAAAVAKVINSYSDIEAGSKVPDNEQILIQRQTTDVLVSGVIFTREIHANLPYYLISYDENGSTDSVTSGKSGRTLMISGDTDVKKLEPMWQNLIAAVREIEELLNDSILDIEFAITPGNAITIFQVRPLAVVRNDKNKISEEEFYSIKSEIKSKYNECRNEYTGNEMMLSDMAFWNPAEIIGTNPRPLDYSLYREIITKDVWSRSLVPLGYKYVNKELMYQIGNKPYISLDYSFYALLPEKIDVELVNKIVKFYSDCLQKDLTAHDKIEFEIVFSSYDFMTDKNIEKMYDYKFERDEIEQFVLRLKELTFSAVSNYDNILEEDKSSLKKLADIRKETISRIASFSDAADIVSEIILLVENLKLYGTTQFARQARYAFMARSFCKSLADAGYFDEKEIEDFMKSIHTVSSDFEKDFALFGEGKMSREEFNEKYGHLRSGTYNIRSRRYDVMDFKNIQTKARKSESIEEKSAHLDTAKLDNALASIGFDISSEKFIAFLKNAMEQREYFKFEFTKTLSQIIEMIAMYGEKMGFTRKEMSWISIEDLKKENLNKIIQRRKIEFEKNKKIILPDTILSANDFDIIEAQEARPNFITSKTAEGKVVVLGDNDNYDMNIEGTIVVLPQADPGYEWIFAKGIKGFITKYGGVASHMAIRCAEFGIPGAIGCGEKIYNYVCRQDYIKLDCKNGKIL